MPSLSHLTSCILTKSNLYLAHSLAAAVNESALYRLLTFQVPNLIHAPLSLLRSYQSISPGPRLCRWTFHNKIHFNREELLAPCPTPSWRTTTCRLSATVYSIYSQLPSILQAVPPSATWRCAMLWWQGPTYHMAKYHLMSSIFLLH